MTGVCLPIEHWPAVQAAVARAVQASAGLAELRFIEGGIEVEHWAVRHLAQSFLDTLGTAPNFRELGVGPIETVEGQQVLVTITRRPDGKTPAELLREAAAERDRLAARVAELERDLAWAQESCP